ncbi:hypothetical protein TSUD_193790, partial [Trifolium subterraneum]
SPLPGYLTRR